jgi:ABC-type oligopeptide transport system substrate-binding subunit/class 3 adenylate cyclase
MYSWQLVGAERAPPDPVVVMERIDETLAGEGIALIADIAGFTPLTELLMRNLSPAEGAEELPRALNSVFTPLIGAIHAYGGEVHKFGGDALICWFPRPRRGTRTALLRRALAAAQAMQALMRTHGTVHTRVGDVTLSMKIGAAYGPALRVRLGDVTHGYEDVLGGATLDRMAAAEHLAQPGEVLLDPAGLPNPATLATVLERRAECLVVGDLLTPPRRIAGPDLPAADAAALRELRAFTPLKTSDDLIIRRLTTAELKPVVSMFVQFTGLNYEAGPAAEAQLGVYFSLAQRAAARYGGRVNRLLTGDKGSVLHLIFGAPQALEDLEVRAAHCALEVRDVAAQLPFISAQRIGMAVGRAFAGLVGAPERHDYTVMGATINLSARLMQAAQPGQIVLDPELGARLDAVMRLTSLGPAQLKGIATPVELLALTGERAAQPAHVPAQAVLGRDNELALLRAQLERLQAGAGGTVVLLGDLGIGKSHVLAALRASTAVRWLTARPQLYGERSGTTLAADLCRAALDLGAGASFADLEAASRRVLGERAGPAAAPFLARLIGVPLEERQARELATLAGESLRWRLRELVRELILAVAARGPLVLALDDLQWAAAADLDLLPAQLPDTAPILWFLAARPDPACSAWPWLEAARAHGAIWLELASLPAAAAVGLIRVHAPGLTLEVAERLAERSGGNPLFLVELARAAALAGLDAALPDTIQGLLLAQIDRLPSELRTTLQRGAVLGQSIDTRLLGALEAEADVTARLDALLGAGFLLGDGSGYTFRHSLLRESAYDALLFADRRHWHGRAAAALERLYPTEIAERAAELALHYERAEQLLSAARYYAMAADAARLLDANETAETGYRRVLALLDHESADTVDLRGRTLLKLAQVRMNAGDYVAAQNFYDQAFTLLEQVERKTTARRRRPPVFRMGVDEPETLDPGLVETNAGHELVVNTFEGLVELDDALNVIPAAAHRWRIEDEGRRYIFELREGLTWSDGATLTAHDFVAAWRRNLDPETGAEMADRLYVVRGATAYAANPDQYDTLGIQARDERTLIVELIEPTGYFLALLATPIAFPQPFHCLQRYGSAWAAPEHLVCNGPFLVQRWQPGQMLTLRKNPHYRTTERIALDRVELRFLTAADDWAQCDALDFVRLADRVALDGDSEGKLITLNYLTTYFLGFACTRQPMDNPLLRRALAACVDREGLVHDIWGGVQLAANGGIIPPGLPGHSPDLALPFDPEAGRVALATLGPVRRLTLAAPVGFGNTPFVLQRSWQEQLGVDIKVESDLSNDAYIAGLADDAYDIVLFGWEAEYPDPDNFLRSLFAGTSPSNYFGWHNAQFDALVHRAASAADTHERMALYHQAEQVLIIQEAAAIPLYYGRMYGLLRSPFVLGDDARLSRSGQLLLSRVRLTTERR